VQLFFTASSRRLDALSTLITPRTSGRDAGSISWDPEAIRVIRMLSADDQGLFLQLDHRLGGLLLQARPRQEPVTPAPVHAPLRLSEKDLTILLGQGIPSDSQRPHPGAGVLELLKYLEVAHPGWLTGGAAEFLVKNPAETAVYLDLIRGLDPPAELLEKYLGYCRSLARAGDSGWNANRTRTSQAIFFLLSAIRSENAISRDSGRRLLESSLAGFDAPDEPAFLFNLYDFLTGTLLPELARSMGAPTPVPGSLIEAMAGREEPRTFLFDGTPLLLDGPAEQMHRMKSALGLQRVAPLPELLDMIRLSRNINQSREGQAESLKALSAKLKTIPAADSTPEPGGRKGRPQTQAITADLPGELESLAADPGRAPRRMAELMKRTAAVLHAELGTVLLAYCYTYHSSSQSSALTYDPDFVRKHAFYPRERSSAQEWLPARMERGSGGGGRITGSLSGLGIQLHQLEMQTSAQSFGKGDWNRLLPAMLSGTRLVPRVLRSERAREFVALTTSLGRELLALCASEPPSERWCAPHISELLSPLRRERLDGLLHRGSFIDAAEALSPSELFLLGQAYLIEAGVLPPSEAARIAPFLRFEEAARAGVAATPPSFSSPALDRLREIVPADGLPALDSFLGEVEQYGPLLWHRLGLEENAFRYCDTYELLRNFTAPDLLFERIVDLKIRVAEIGYSAGLPASIGGLLEQQAIQNIITDPASPRVDSWDGVIQQIRRLGPGNSRGWVEELLNQGTLAIYSAKPNDKAGER
jgi:hypothetical protein